MRSGTALAVIVVCCALVAGCGGSEDAQSCPSPCADAGGSGGAASGGTAGCSDCDAGDGQAGWGGGEGCVDEVVTKSLLSDPKAWLPAVSASALPGGLWGSNLGMHFAWVGYRFVPEGSTGKYLSDSAPWLIVSTLEPSSGLFLGHDRYELFPPGISAEHAVIWSIAGRPDGTFAVGYKWWENGSGPQRVALGKVGTPGLSATLTLPAAAVDPLSIIAQTAAAWDGEAFALHAYGSPGISLYVARVDEQAGVLLPFTKFGATMNIDDGLNGHRTSTNADSGRTYVMDAKVKRVLNGHSRDGTPLPDTPKYIDPIGIPPVTSGAPVVAADSSGAWVAWQQDETRTPSLWHVVQRTTLDGTPVGGAVKLPSQPLDDPGGICVSTVVSHNGTAEVLQASGSAIYSTTVAGDSVGAPSRFVHGNGQEDTCQIHELFATEWNGETWLAFVHNAEYLRVLKVKDGCTYPFAPVGNP